MAASKFKAGDSNSNHQSRIAKPGKKAGSDYNPRIWHLRRHNGASVTDLPTTNRDMCDLPHSGATGFHGCSRLAPGDAVPLTKDT
jgi:hypothetical protein